MDQEALRLPSPEKKRSVFVFHSEKPDSIVRLEIPATWEAFVETARSRLRLLTIEAVFDATTGVCRHVLHIT